MHDDPFQRILNDDWGIPGGEKNPLSEAVSEFGRCVDPSRIEPILRSPDPGVVTNGLYVLSETVRLPGEVLDLALEHVQHPDWYARFYLANSLLLSHDILSVGQMAKALSLAEDAVSDVRCKMMELLKLVPPPKLDAALKAADQLHEKSDHQSGLQILEQSQMNTDDLVRIVADGTPVLRCYAGARLLMNAIGGAGICMSSDSNEELEYLKWRLSLIERYPE